LKYRAVTESFTKILAGFLIGFDQSAVIVTEGETVTLNISYRRDIELISVGNFMVFTQQGMGNATG
jgi:hypothetical protein